jgi:carboxylesterase type B
MHATMLLLSLCSLFFFFGGAEAAANGLIVNTVHGPVEGLQVGDKGARRWQGVPYAEPPLGKLRWKNAIDPTPWTKTKDCKHFDIGCAQRAHSMDVPKNTSEDCLYLEIWAPPAGKYKEPANVMVWIYGGDFKEGGESFKLYDGKYLASETNTILVVTNYRVGNLGFLFTPHTDTNVGLMDQRFTLRWVQQNIKAFGGNPEKVTVFGQSAGGQSVLFHLSAPDAYTAKFFHRAIVESGPLSLNFKHPDAGYLLV